MRQYLRKVRLTADNLVINPSDEVQLHELKIEFSVTKGLSSTQNSARIRIYNLSEDNRNALGKELDTVTLEAGYMPPEGGGNLGVIFKGQIRDIEHKREDTDIVTTLSCGDGDKAIRNATIGKTFPAGTPVSEVVEEIYKEFEKEGIDRGEWKFPEDLPKFKRPYTVCGTCKREMDTLSRGYGFYWSMQNQTMEIIPSDGYIGTVVLLSPETGLIDTPTITDNGVKFSALLNPEIRPNRRIRLEAQTLEMNAENGEYRVGEVTYSGNNREGDFTVSGTAESIAGGKVDEGKWKDKK